MNKNTIIALAVAALSVTTALSTAAQARGFGGHFGGGGMRSFGGMRSAPMKLNSFRSSKSFSSFKSFRSKPSFSKRTFKPSRSFVHKQHKVFKSAPKLTRRFKHQPKLHKQIVKQNNKLKQMQQFKTAKHLKQLKQGKPLNHTLAKLKSNKLFGHKLMGKKMFANKMLANKLALHNAKPVFHKLNHVQMQKAMHFDFTGKKFSMAKKAWWDGKHWWFGAGALTWVFVDGGWYYGDEPVYWADDAWRTESGFVAECLDCVTETVTRRRVASVGSASDDSASSPRPVTRVSAGTASEPAKVDQAVVKTAGGDVKTKTTTPMSTEAVLIKSNTASFTDQTGELPAEAATPSQAAEAATPGAEAPAKVAEAVVEPAPGSEADEPAAIATETEASPMIDCKRFVPAVGMTVSVPCGK